MTGAPPDPKHDDLLGRWARFAARRRWLVLLAWVVLLAGIGFAWRSAGDRYADRFSIPGAEAQDAYDLLGSRFPTHAGEQAYVVFEARDGVSRPETRARIEQVAAELADLPDVTEVAPPFAPESAAVSPDGTVAYATVQYRARAAEIPTSSVNALTSVVDRSGGDGLRVEVGGPIIEAHEIEPPGRSEAIGLAASVVILLVAFGSVIATGLPILTALFGLGTGFAAVGLTSHVMGMGTFTPAFASMIGLGVGIDYALLVVTRYREALHRGLDVEDAVVQAVSAAGRSVAFAGGTVVIALLGLMAIGIPFVGALGVAAAVIVALAVLVAVTLLPALLAVAGRGVDRWRVPFLHATESSSRTSVWFRLSRQIQRHALVYLGLALVILLALTVPVLSLRIGSSDAGNNPTSLHSRRAYDLLAQGFGPGFNGPLLLVADFAEGGSLADLQALQGTLARTEGVAAVTPPVPNQAGDAAIMRLVPTTSPQSEETQDLVHALRNHVIPDALAGSGATVYVGGTTAAFIDIGDRIGERMPVFLGAVIGLSFLLLMAVFRSVLIPLKAALMNLLSIGAAYGVVVAVFQWGWLAGPIGVRPGPIESFLPMMLFAILFGLSMDYEVFLISRIYEEHDAGETNSESVANGLAVTARVITAAAAIMVCVFGSFVLGDSRVVKEFGVGLATAIFIDATIVRLLLVPAAMELMGEANWWLPRWLNRLLPRLTVEPTGVNGGREPEEMATTPGPM